MKKTVSILASSCMALSLIFSGCGDEELQPKEVSYGEVNKETFTYENEYLGMGAKLTEEFELQSAEDLGQNLDDAKAMFEDTELEESVEDAQMFMDVQALNPDNGDNFNILYQELNKEEWNAYAQASDDEIIDGVFNQKDQLQKSFEEAGLDVVSMEKGSLKFVGETVPTIETKVEMYGMTLYIVQVAKFNLGGKYGIMITFTSTDEAGIQSMADSFYAL